MSVEHQHTKVEHGERNATELEAARHEKLEQLREGLETDPTERPERRAEAAREVINKQEQAPEPTETHESTPAAPVFRPLLDHKLNYEQTLASMQRQLKPVSRAFSKVIHTPAVEKTSEILEKTIARPSVTAGATWTALIIGGLFYFVARTFGYALSGSEMLFSFIVGAIMGLALEGLWRAYNHH